MAATGASPRLSPTVVVFDVNETLLGHGRHWWAGSRTSAPLRSSRRRWFAGLLRDGFALAAAGASAPFAVSRRRAPADPAAPGGLDRTLDEAVEHVMAGFAALEVHPDVPDGIRALAAGRAAPGHAVQRVGVSRTDAAGKGRRRRAPGTAALRRGRRRVEARPGRLRVRRRPVRRARPDLLLVPVHPWDIDGAARAGLRTAWVTGPPPLTPGTSAEPTWRSAHWWSWPRVSSRSAPATTGPAPTDPACGRGPCVTACADAAAHVWVPPPGQEPHDEHRRGSGDDPRGVHRGLPAHLPVPDHVGARRTGRRPNPPPSPSWLSLSWPPPPPPPPWTLAAAMTVVPFPRTARRTRVVP